jgi:glycosyltransferase involved in cell wall biosynthesis
MGGAERSIHEIFTRIAARGHDVELVTWNKGELTEETLDGFNVHQIGSRLMDTVPKPLRRVLKLGRLQVASIRRVFQQNDFDIVVSLYGFPFAGTLYVSKRIFSTPTTILEHHLGAGLDVSSPDENPWYIDPVLQVAYRDADGIIATSNSNRSFVTDVSGREDIDLIPLGVDSEARHPGHADPSIMQDFTAQGPLLLTVSRLVERKNITDMLDAMTCIRVEHPDAHLLIVGDGPHRETLQERIREKRLSNEVTMAGEIPEERLQTLFATATLYLSTATYEGFGLSILEALASGTPVVAYDAHRTQEFLSDTNSAVVTSHQPSALAREVKDLLIEDGRLSRCSSKAREFAASEFSWDTVADRHLDVFSEIVDESRCRGFGEGNRHNSVSQNNTER